MIPALFFAHITSPLQVIVGNPTAPPVTAQSSIVIDAKTGRILTGKNIHTSRYPASTTKILTGLIFAERAHPSDTITAPAGIEKIKGSSLHLKSGEVLSGKDMLYGLMLRSANDGASTIARKIAGSEEKFATLMNQRAQEIGCENSLFFTPHGLNHPYHKTTAYDLALIAKEAIQNPWFRQVVGQAQYTVTRTINTKDTLLKNSNKLLEIDSTIQGIKTGYTNPAGRCFVGLISLPDREFITVILKSKNWERDQLALSDWVKATYTMRSPQFLGPSTLTIPVKNGKEELAKVKLRSTELALLSDYDLQYATLNPNQLRLEAPIKESELLAAVDFVIPDGTTFKANLFSEEDIDRKSDLTPTGIALLAAISAVTYWMKSRARKQSKRRRR